MCRSRFEDVADICVRSGPGESNEVIEAVGPETFTFEGLVRLIAQTIGRRPFSRTFRPPRL
jgi:uncharacterized protein YbjT (DUF2867 family)